MFVNACDAANTAIVSVAAGNVRTADPSAPVVGCNVIDPVVRLANASVPSVEPATPNVGVAVKAGAAPAKTVPAAPVIETAPAPDTAIGETPVIDPPPEDVTHVGHVRTPVVAFKTIGVDALDAKVPVVVGRVRTVEPAADCGLIVADPLDDPRNTADV